MREILFRGKRLDNGEWVEGYLYITHNGEHEISIYNDEVNIERWTHEVDPSTVGQYTGLKDKHGKRIFENGYMIIDKQPYKVLFDNGEYILKNIFNCDIIQLKNNSKGIITDNPELL